MVSLKIAGTTRVCRGGQIINLLQIHLLIVLFDKIRIHGKYVLQKMLVLYCISLCAVQTMSAHHLIIEH